MTSINTSYGYLQLTDAGLEQFTNLLTRGANVVNALRTVSQLGQIYKKDSPFVLQD
jgi:uncharacterized protein YceH (UPF0502 family)